MFSSQTCSSFSAAKSGAVTQPLSCAAAAVQVLRVHVTPTRVKFLPAEVQSGNRVIRHFCSPAAADR